VISGSPGVPDPLQDRIAPRYSLALMAILTINLIVHAGFRFDGVAAYKARNMPIDTDSGQSNKNNEVKKRGGGKVNCLQFIGGPI